METAMAAVREAAAAALAGAAVSPEDVACLVAGMTGADWPDEYPLLRANILMLGLCSRVTVTNDSLIALRGGTEKSYGAVLIAGSGGNCAVRSPSGEEFIYAYYHDGDLQGGHALGRRALQAIYRAETGREAESALKARVLGFYGFQTVDALLRADVEDRLDPDIKELAPLIFEEAWCGDPVAGYIVQDFARGYAGLAAAALRRLGMADLEVEVVLSGSIFKARGPLLVETLAAALRQAVPRARLVNARYEPVVGAVLLALEAMHIPIDAPIKDQIEKSAQHLGLIRGTN
jgi:N-acetylglucosamine kinase-like BadF-type ATPase